MRILLTVVGAAALLYTFSYPYSIIPPHPYWDYDSGITPNDIRPWIWIAPWLFTELVSSLGSRRNLVWFSGVLFVLIAAFMAWPVLTANYPELVYPTLPFDDGKLAWGFKLYGLFAVGSVLFRLVLLSFLFASPEKTEENDANYAEADVLDPANARTVREIAADPVHATPKFLFGDADMGLVARFGVLMQKLARVRACKWIALLLALAFMVGWFFLYPQPSAYEAFQRDLARMYEVRGYAARESLPADFPIAEGARGLYLATSPAVHSAYRVMSFISDHESFAGMKREDAEQWLHLDRVKLAPGYLKQLRDESDISLPSVNDIFDSRTRFLTVTDGKRTTVLYIRFGQDDETITIAEVQDAGWNPRADHIRFRYGADVSSKLLN